MAFHFCRAEERVLAMRARDLIGVQTVSPLIGRAILIVSGAIFIPPVALKAVEADVVVQFIRIFDPADAPRDVWLKREK